MGVMGSRWDGQDLFSEPLVAVEGTNGLFRGGNQVLVLPFAGDLVQRWYRLAGFWVPHHTCGWGACCSPRSDCHGHAAKPRTWVNGGACCEQQPWNPLSHMKACMVEPEGEMSIWAILR